MRSFLLAGAAIAAAFGAGAAQAAYHFDLVGGHTMSFTIADTAAGWQPTADDYGFNGVSGLLNGSPALISMFLSGGSVEQFSSGSLTLSLLHVGGPDLFQPGGGGHFNIGVHSFAGYNGAGAYTLTISGASDAPEPATWAMAILGFGAVGTSLRSRQRASVRFA